MGTPALPSLSLFPSLSFSLYLSSAHFSIYFSLGSVLLSLSLSFVPSHFLFLPTRHSAPNRSNVCLSLVRLANLANSDRCNAEEHVPHTQQVNSKEGGQPE